MSDDGLHTRTSERPVHVRHSSSHDRSGSDGAAPVKLAVIITCFNYSRFVDRAIESVLSQDCADCRLIVIDDGSTDDSWDVICRRKVQAFRIPNGGQRKACLYGLQQTNAPFVLFLDADDELLPGSLDLIVACLDERVAKLQFPLTRIDGDGNMISGPVPELKAFRGRDLVSRVLQTGVYATPPTSGNVFRRDVCDYLQEADYDKAVDGVILFVAPFLGEIVSLPQPLGLYRVHGSNDSAFGGELNVGTLRRDRERFEKRMEHLRRILPLCGYPSGLIATEHAYFHRERSLYIAVAENQWFPVSDIVGLLGRLWGDGYPFQMKITMTAFFVTVAALPRARARRALEYRLGAGPRSAWGFVRALI